LGYSDGLSRRAGTTVINSGQKLNWIETIGIVGIIASLVFVGYQIKLSRDIARADIYQNFMSMIVEIQLTGVTNEPLTQALVKDRLGDEELTYYEQYLIWRWLETFMTAKDSLLIQHRLGLVSDDLWEIERRNISSQMQWACFHDFWTRASGSYSDDFAREVESALEAYPIEDCTSVEQ
jgi:hypothetical protein